MKAYLADVSMLLVLFGVLGGLVPPLISSRSYEGFLLGVMILVLMPIACYRYWTWRTK